MDDPTLSPLHSPDVAGVAPALVITAGFDPIRDEGLAHAERLRLAGVEVESLHFPGQIHGFLSLDRVLSGARDALELIGAILAETFGEDAPPPRRVRPLHVVRRLNQPLNEAVVAGLALQDRVKGVVGAITKRTRGRTGDARRPPSHD